MKKDKESWVNKLATTNIKAKEIAEKEESVGLSLKDVLCSKMDLRVRCHSLRMT